MKTLRILVLVLLGTVGMSIPAAAQFYYGLFQEYGKNRVQYNDEFLWRFYRFDRFDVYFYTGGTPIAQRASFMMEQQIKQIERTLETSFDERIQVLVFNSLSDLKQSNLNVEDQDTEASVGGILRTLGSKMFVYFDGDYTHLEYQIREGLAELAINNLIYGGFANNLRNSAFLTLPDWYLEGLISYLAFPITPKMDQQIMDGFRTKRYKNIHRLTGDEAKYAGHSFWQYLTLTYGDNVVRNVLFLTLINRDVSDGLQYVIGLDLKEALDSWRSFYESKYASGLSKTIFEGEKVRHSKRDQTLDKLAISKNGQYMAYHTNREGRYEVFVYDREKNRNRRVLKKGFRIAENVDNSYPLMAWNPNNRILAMIIEHKGFTWLYYYDMQKKKTEKRKLFGFEKILSFSYSADGKEFLISGVKNGRSDIFVYTIISTTIDRITNDDYTDLYPAFMNNDKQIVFSSNRPHDTIISGMETYRFDKGMNLFVYDRRKPKEGQLLWRLTDDAGASAIQPVEFEPGYISYLSDVNNGLRNQFIVSIDSFISYVDTTVHYDYRFNKYLVDPKPYHIATQIFTADKQIDLVYNNRRFELYERPAFDINDLQGATKFRTITQGPSAPKTRASIASETGQNLDSLRATFEIDITNYTFHPALVEGLPNTSPKPSRRAQPLATGTVQEKPKQKVNEKEDFEFPSLRNYALTFFRDDFSVEIDNIFANPQYQPFTGRPDGQLLNPGFNIMTKVGIVDLMNDYRLTLGFRTDFQPVAGLSISPNSEILATVTNNRKRLNQGYSFYRRSQIGFGGQFFTLRNLSYQGNYIATWPFNEVMSIRGTAGYRHDRFIPLAENQFSFVEDIRTENYAITKLEFIYDNTIKKGLNLMRGTRYKVFAEYYHNIENNPTGLWTAGLDFRNYTPVHGSIIWANRLAYGTSFGPEKLIYFMGGVDNQFRPQFDESIPVAQNENYVFQTLVTNMRGFFQNARNGNNFGVLNSELRVPIVKYLANRPIRNDFLANLQLVPFFDVGTAWNGPSPYSPENAINTEVIESGPGGSLTIILQKQKNPFIYGYGMGIRSRLFGYFFRVDWAYGVEDGIILPRVLYFSFGTDF